MDNIPWVEVFFRWVHVGTAIVLVGGSVFMRFVLMPAAQPLPESEHAALRERLMGTWKKFVMTGIFLLLISGFYNYIEVAIPAHKGQSIYHMLMGVKILLSFAVFFLGSALVGRSAALEGIRRNRKQWLAVTVLMAAVVVGLAGFLKVAAKPVGPTTPPTTALSD